MRQHSHDCTDVRNMFFILIEKDHLGDRYATPGFKPFSYFLMFFIVVNFFHFL